MPKYYAVWPIDDEAVGPFQTRAGRPDVFTVAALAHRCLERTVGPLEGYVREVRIVPVGQKRKVRSAT